MTKYIKLLMVAIFATMTFALTSCGGDDDEPSGGKEGADYTFKINDVTYYYGCDYFYEGVKFTEIQADFDPADNGNDYILLSVNAQDVPIKVLDENGEFVSYQPGDFNEASLMLYIENFNPESTKSGTELTLSNGSISPKFGYYLRQRLDLTKKEYPNHTIWGRFDEDQPGKIKFVSYKTNAEDYHGDHLTVEFENFTFYEVGDDESLNKTKKYVINGKVIFRQYL